MRIATWNVNSVRSRIARVEAFVERHGIDVLALQETKARDDEWPTMGLEAMGYEVASLGHNQWNGVAVVSRVGLEDVEHGFPGMPECGEPLAAEARAMGANCGGVRVWSLYVPNGRKPDDPAPPRSRPGSPGRRSTARSVAARGRATTRRSSWTSPTDPPAPGHTRRARFRCTVTSTHTSSGNASATAANACGCRAIGNIR